MIERVLDRIPSVPDRRRATDYPVEAVVDGLAPRSYTWRCDLWLDQGQEGACVPHGWTHEAAARPVVVSSWPRPNFTSPDPQSFAFEAYDWCRRNDEWPGHDYAGTSVAAGAKCMVRAGTIGEYRWTDSVDEMKVAVSRIGPVVIGVDWHTGMYNPDPAGFLHARGRVTGGHCILVNGYSLRLDAFRLHNSWGPGWGMNGEALLSSTDMAVLMGNGGEACLPIRRHL